MHQSVPRLTIPWAIPGDSRIPVAPVAGLSLLVFARGSPAGGGGKFDNFEKSAIFTLLLKQMSSSSFHMFVYARSEQCHLIGSPTYVLII